MTEGKAGGKRKKFLPRHLLVRRIISLTAASRKESREKKSIAREERRVKRKASPMGGARYHLSD